MTNAEQSFHNLIGFDYVHLNISQNPVDISQCLTENSNRSLILDQESARTSTKHLTLGHEVDILEPHPSATTKLTLERSKEEVYMTAAKGQYTLNPPALSY